MKFQRRWTQAGPGPYEGIPWVPRKCVILNQDGQEIFVQEDVEAPSFWSQSALDIAASKYFRRQDVPGPKGRETSLRQLIDRVMLTIAEQGEQQGVFAAVADQHTFLDELRYLLIRQYAAFNSPVWFNCGLFARYKIQGDMTGWRWDEDNYQVVKTKGAYEYPQCSACFILKIEDNLTSIFELALKEARIFKFGSGSGTNFSPLRGKQENISGGGHSSGLLAFLEVLDKGAAATKSGGITRRAAKMVCLDMDHPEVLDFINWKYREEEKARVLMKAGYSGGIDGEILRTISGQNSNNSLRIPDEFMEAVLASGEWTTKARTSGKDIQTYQAQTLWQAILESIWHCADPGLQFESAIQRAHTCRSSGPIRASNPCSEFMFLDDTACNLASLNLARFLNESTGEFDLTSFRRAIRLLVTAQEVLVSYSSYPTEDVAVNSHRFRPLGLGFANLGGLLLRMGLPYDSQVGRAWAAGLSAWMQAEALKTSCELAQIKGSFAAYKANHESYELVLAQQHASAQRLVESPGFPEELKGDLVQIYQQAMDDGKVHGFRHAQLTAIAPTGTIGLFMDCETTGIEPEFALVKNKKMAGGGVVTQVNSAVDAALKRLGYGPDIREELLQYVIQHGHLEGAPHLKPEHLPVFDCAVPTGKAKRTIRPEAHLEVMAEVQPFVSGAISKTINLPESATTKDIGELLIKAWQMGLKSISIYRDGSKLVQPLSVAKKDQNGSTLKCSHCGHEALVQGGCFRCPNCGHADACN
ncbi:MAG: vitamin B12-dependent ribonucleotide reductase [Bdellovibrionaceae bacterium]|nr:vitamin B12-dependent ribonucleotide reductase [Bdellovibrionales bacterium]MCB9084359.1 vitamin B12-dependent ribonucleotide reductase [Pseudobdellovibrionaceae bacterium]